MTINRRDVMLGTAAVAALASVPVLPALVAPIQDGKPLLSFIAGSEGESDWQWIRAVDKGDSLIQWMLENHGLDECELVTDGEATEPPDDCDCDFCRHYCQLDADRVKRWDDRTDANPPTPADWLVAGYSFRCDCGQDHAVALGDGGFICPDGVNVECEDCHDKRKRDDAFRAEQHDLTESERSSLDEKAPTQTCGNANAQGAGETVSTHVRAIHAAESPAQGRNSF